MPVSKKEEPYMPMLVFMLQNRKTKELINSMLSQTYSAKLLLQYGHKMTVYNQLEQFKMRENAQKFDVCTLIYIKGSSGTKINRFQNASLIQTIKNKLRANCVIEPLQRKMLWLQFTDIFVHGHLYQGLGQLQVPTDTEALIQKDVSRTYYTLNDHLDQVDKKEKLNKLRLTIKQALCRFAIYNPYLLYCQGMNSIAGFFYQEGFSAKQIFFIFKRLSEVLLPSDYYSSLQGITTFMKILWQMISITHVKIFKKLNQIVRQLDVNGNFLIVFSFCLQWFVCLFTNTGIPRNIRRVIMDYLIVQDITVLFKTSLAFFDYLQQTILSVKSFEEYIIKVETKINTFTDQDKLRKRLNQTYISLEILRLLKQYESPAKQSRIKQSSPYTKKCNKKWNYCIQKLQNNTYQHHKYEFFVFRRNQKVTFIQDYLQKINKFYFQQKTYAKKSDMLRIGRILHICNGSSEQVGTQDSISQIGLKQSHRSIAYSPNNNQTFTIDIKSPRKSKERSHIAPRQFCLYEQQQQVQGRSESLNYHRKQTLQVRDQIKRRLEKETNKKSLQKSQSVMFMKMMVQNVSYSNLLDLLQNQEMDNMFAQYVDEDEAK